MNDMTPLRRQIYLLLMVGAVAMASGRIFNLRQDKIRNVELSPTFSSNDRSRWATVRSLVDRGTYVVGQRVLDPKTGKFEDSGIITQEGWKTVDRVLDPEPVPDQPNVHYFYSSKPPLYSTVVAGEYWLLKHLCGLSVTTDLAWIVRIVLLTFNVLPLAIYLLLLGRLADQFGTSDWGRLFLVFAAGYGTFVTSFATTLNNHTLATFLALFGLCAFLRIWRAPARQVETSATPAERPPTAAEQPATTGPASPPLAEKPVTEGEQPAASSSSEPAATGEAGSAAPADPTEAASGEKAPAGQEAEEEEDEGEAGGEEEETAFSAFRMTETASPTEAPAAAATPKAPAGGLWYLLAGLCCTLAAALELPAAALTAAVFGLLLLRDWRRTLIWFLPAALLASAAYLGTNYLAIGRLVPVQAQGVDSAWYQFEGSHWRQDKPKTGIDFAQEDKLTYSLHLLVGHHGVFALSPIYLLSLAGILAILWRRGSYDSGLVILACLTLVLTVAVIGFYIWKTNNYGGWSSGPRWLMWLTPLWLLTLLPVADKLAGCRWGRSLALLLLGLSVLSASYPTWNPWQHPWLYQYVESFGWMKY